MNDQNMYGYQDLMTAGAPGPGPPVPPSTSPNTNLAQYKFSPDELRVLQDCNRESFFQRSLPIGTALGLAAGAAVQQGYLKPNARFGAFPKVTLAVVVGYFVGKLSYQQACAEKMMALPGSYIGQLLRDRRDGKIGGTSMSHNQAPTSMLGAKADDIYSDAGPGSSLDLDSDRAGRVFSEDLSRPENNGPVVGPPPDAAGRPPLTYDEMRRKNRTDHADARQDPYRLDPASTPTVTRRVAPLSPPPSKNAYGDVVE